METVDLAALDEKSQILLENTELEFMGKKVTAISIFGSRLLKDLPVWNIFSFKREATLKELFYSNQEISGESKEFQSATEFAKELIKGGLKFVLISSDAGMGKSTALKQIAKTLQKELSHCWIVHLNLFEIQNELFKAKKTLKSKAAAIAFVRNIVLADRMDDGILKKLFDWKLEAKEMVFLFDSLDEICPDYRETASNLIEGLRETELQIVLTTRPHEGKNISGAEVFELQPISEWKMKKEFLRKIFETLGIPQPPVIEHWYRNISGNDIEYDEDSNYYEFDTNDDVEDNFWDVPMALVMAVTIYGTDMEVKAAYVMPNRAATFAAFIQKSVEETLLVKFGFNKELVSQKSVFEKSSTKYTELIEILAIWYMFHRGETKEQVEKIKANGEFINRFVVAKIDSECTSVSFLHKSYAEYLVATLFFPNKSSQTVKLNNEQLRNILLKEEFSEIRKHICGILAASPTEKIISLSNVIEGEEEEELLYRLIDEDCYELYYHLKKQLCCADNNFFPTSDEGESVHMLYLALENARKEFILALIDDGARFEDILHENGVLNLAVKNDLFDLVKSHITLLIPDINKEIRFMYPLQYAARNGSLEMVQLLIENGADVNCTVDEDKTPLYYAIKANSLKVVNLLIANGADLTYALKWALEQQQKKLLPVIYEKIPQELQNKCLTEALTYAAKKGNLEWCKFLCFKGANPTVLNEKGESSVHRASKRDHLECVQYFLEQHPSSVDVRNEQRQTPLMVAFQYWREDVIECLILEKNANLNAADKDGKTVLHYAAEKGYLHFVEMIVNAGADIDATDNDGRTALFYASVEGEADVVEYLLENKANPLLTDIEGNTCLHEASGCYGGLECVKLLVELITVNCQNNKKETPIHLAASRYGGEEIVAYLLKKGADPNSQNVDGETSLHYAAKGYEALEIVTLLIKNNADFEVKNNNGETPLHLAARAGTKEVVAYLLEKGADPNLKDVNGETSIQ